MFGSCFRHLAVILVECQSDFVGSVCCSSQKILLVGETQVAHRYGSLHSRHFMFVFSLISVCFFVLTARSEREWWPGGTLA